MNFITNIYIYIYIYICICPYIQETTFTRTTSVLRQRMMHLAINYVAQLTAIAVSFHNFKSQNFKLSVSNPKNNYVAYVYVLSPISSCQGLGRKTNSKF